jgi:hypothetical protein
MEETRMNTPAWTKPVLIGAGVGAVATLIAGFGWGGWITGAKAEVMVSDQAKAAVVAALAPICVEQSRQDPAAAATLAKLKESSRYQRSEMLMEAGWATMPGSEGADRAVANACMEELAAAF